MSRLSKISDSSKLSSLHISKSTVFKSLLLSGVLTISAVFVLYTFDMIDKLQEDTQSQVEKYIRMWQLAANSPTSGSEIQFIFEEIIVKATFPIIVLDRSRDPIHWRNIEGIDPMDTSLAARDEIKSKAFDLIEQNGEYPLYFGGNFVNYLCYGDTAVIQQLKIMPFVVIGIAILFMMVTLIGFHNLRRSEERHIWVGMAKETAHQLGTPISALMGWLEIMESDHCGGEDKLSLEIQDTIDNMKVDIIRLQKVARRFGLIGSIPELTLCNLNEQVKEAVDYYSRRLPFEGRGTQLGVEAGEIPDAMLNQELFSWVLENHIKNALEAVDPKTGMIMLKTRFNDPYIVVEIIDNGKGITPAAARKIFRPGFTTKKRGWGLGLTLVKRIVEEYHGGHISLKKSKPGETIFEILIPAGKI